MIRWPSAEREPLYDCVERGDLNLLNQVDTKYKRARLAVHACAVGHFESFMVLVSGWQFESEDWRMIASYAMRTRCWPILEWLLDRQLFSDKQVLEIAARYPRTDLFSWLFDRGVCMGAGEGMVLELLIRGMPLASRDHLNCVQLLLTRGILRWCNGHEALRMAVRHSHLDVMEWLIGAGVSVEASRCVEEAVKGGKLLSLRYLLERGARPMYLAEAVCFASKDIVKMLLRYGTERYCSLADALVCAVDIGRGEMVQLLLEAGADVHCGGSDQAHEIAICRGYDWILRTLLCRGGVLRQNERRLSVLALERGEIEMILELQKYCQGIVTPSEEMLREVVYERMWRWFRGLISSGWGVNLVGRVVDWLCEHQGLKREDVPSDFW